jgi:short-subunit dehydrogenase
LRVRVDRELATPLANYFEQQKKGSLLVISSVAGDRGRQSNYVYGATKSALSAFTDGLRNRLCKHGVTVVTVKPGFVDSPMTQDLKKGGPLWASPEKIAEDMDKTLAKGGTVLYTPWFWRYIMLIIKQVPDFIFRKMSL